mgnify:CR=1 FL=1
MADLTQPVAIPQRITLSRAKGWRMPPNTVKVDRSTKLGNPFPIDVYGREKAVDKFRRLITGNMSTFEMSTSSRQDWASNHGISLVFVREQIRQKLPELRGKNLACWCKPGEPCHADVLLEIANAPSPHISKKGIGE